MSNASLLRNSMVIAALVCAAWCAPPLRAQEAETARADEARVTESEQVLGAFPLGAQAFTVVTRSQTVTPATNRRWATTVAELEIRDAGGGAVYRENFPAALGDGRFLQVLTVTASQLEGAGGRALLLRFIEDAGTAGAAPGESWQMFGVVNGKLARYGAPLPLGQGGAAVNGVLTGVMVRGGIGVVPLASTAEALEFRVWAGNFFVGVPVRVDWSGGQWSEGEQCFANQNGQLQPVGCNLRVTADRQAIADGAAVTLYAQPEEDAYNARRIALRPNSAVEVAAARALARWQNSGERFTCAFDPLWLRVRIDGNDGWIHSPEDFAALGLAAPPPAR